MVMTTGMSMGTETKMTVLYSSGEIEAVVDKLAGKITRAYAGKRPLLLGILKGSFIFLADLVRRLDFPLEIDFIRLSSYGSARENSGNIAVLYDVRTPVKSRDVLIIEDIVDTGLTIEFLIHYLEERNPASVKICCLLDKPSRRQVPVKLDYIGLTVPDRFLVGYGLDWDEKYRNLPDIHCLEK